jgi:hypothetical protein
MSSLSFEPGLKNDSGRNGETQLAAYDSEIMIRTANPPPPENGIKS